ncbi:MAG: hypothetical protein AAFU58_01590, partial [Pseudomonadota bacterium]
LEGRRFLNRIEPEVLRKNKGVPRAIRRKLFFAGTDILRGGSNPPLGTTSQNVRTGEKQFPTDGAGNTLIFPEHFRLNSIQKPSSFETPCGLLRMRFLRKFLILRGARKRSSRRMEAYSIAPPKWLTGLAGSDAKSRT